MNPATLHTLWGLFLVLWESFVWLGQVIAATAPTVASRFGLSEPRDSVDPMIWADNRSEAVWDALSLWTLPLTGALLLVGHAAWSVVGLVACGMVLSFSGRALVQRRMMQSLGVRVGTPVAVRLAYGVMSVCAAVALITAAPAIRTLL
jgi:hypothetical protein